MNYVWRPARLVICPLILAFCTAAPQANAMQEWNVVGSGNWFTSTNWSPAGIPNSSLTANVNNGGTATATSGGPIEALGINLGKNGGTGHLEVTDVSVNVQTSLDVGDVESTFTTSGSVVNSSGSASFTGSGVLQFGLGGLGDVNVAQTSATTGATASGTATLLIDQVGSVSLPGDLDLGQTSGDGNATGHGTATITDVTGTFSIGGDLDVGQTSAAVNGNNAGNAQLSVDQVELFSIGADVDVAQTTGGGTSIGTANASFENVTLLDISDSLDVAKIRAFATADNRANADVIICDSDVTVGFSATNAGSIEIARVLVSESALGRGTGRVSIINSGVDVANDVIVGELALGGTNASNLAHATLQVIDSKLDTRDFSVAVRLDGTAGTVTGEVELQRSLLVVQSLLDLSSDATLRMQIDGTTRSLGDGLVDDYSAIDADMASLGGTLEIIANANYLGPVSRGGQDSFELITTLFGLARTFDTISYDGVTLGNGVTYVGATGAGDDGLFVQSQQTATALSISNYLALPGDANGDMTVNGQDFVIWNSFKFQAGTDWTQGDFNGDGITDGQDFVIWNNNKFTSVAPPLLVPESSTCYVSLGMLLPLMCRRVRRR